MPPPVLPPPAAPGDYLSAMQALLPTGPAWPRDRDARLTRLLAVWAPTFADVHNLALALRAEADPRRTQQLLPEWEAFAGLPDPCTGAYATTVQERRQHLVARLLFRGGQHPDFFRALAETLGYTVEVTENRPFSCGFSECGGDHQCCDVAAVTWPGSDPPVAAGNTTIRRYWQVTVTEPRIVTFRCGESECGDSLGFVVRAEDLECLITRMKPGHMVLRFEYVGD